MAGTQGICHLQSEIYNRIAQRIMALLGAADAVEFAQAFDADGGIRHIECRRRMWCERNSLRLVG